MKTALPRIVATILPLLVLAVACGGKVIQPLDENQSGVGGQAGNTPGAGGAGGAGAGGAPQAGAAGAAGSTTSCVHSIPAQPPSISSAGGSLDLVFAASSIRFGGDGAQAVGFDIDMTCTCQGESDSCLAPGWATASRCDGFDGKDNNFGTMMADFASLVPEFSENAWNSSIASGGWSIVLRVRNYNGEADDDAVELDWYVPDEFGPNPPKLDGNDAWPISTACLQSGELDQPRYQDLKAYVSGGVLVARLPKVVLLPHGWLTMTLTDAVVTARPLQTSSGWRLQDGNIAAVWTLDEIFDHLSELDLPGMTLCADPGSQIYAGIKKMICSRADIYRAPGTPTAPCDSVSVGLGFDAVSALFGQLTVPVAKPPPCSLGQDPANDSCDN